LTNKSTPDIINLSNEREVNDMAVIKPTNDPCGEKVYLTKEERKILELALPILNDLEDGSEYFGLDEIVYCLCEDYDDNNGKLPAVIELE
jgi:hypothetical protein